MALGVEAEHIAQKMPKQLFIDFFNIHIGAIYNVYIYLNKGNVHTIDLQK